MHILLFFVFFVLAVVEVLTEQDSSAVIFFLCNCATEMGLVENIWEERAK